MNQVISTHKKEVSIYAPKVQVIKVKIEKIRDIIGVGGKIISRIIEKHDNVKIDIKQDGKIFITHVNIDIVKKTANHILNLVKEIEINQVYQVTVVKILTNNKGQSFAALVEIFPNVEGFIHVSQLSNTRTEFVEDVLNVGNKVLAKCIEINNKGKIFLSLKDI